MLKNCRFSKIRRQQRRPGIRADLTVRLQSRFGLEAPDGFFGCGAEVAVRGLAPEELAAAAGIAAVDQEKLGGLDRGADGTAFEDWKVNGDARRHKLQIISLP